ncbi:hypothetical protein POTOM_018042 [Populus tomentosa]|uniref:Nuclear speckle splicing regulatory protein 1 N-terminal domain-containing protein n=1 Tax=Populus tomentosa TaxID=118781 RepID=A0A8X8D776_POPTO|nr:hypothetical protein POTOM_018042 [Populus tomentosa]
MKKYELQLRQPQQKRPPRPPLPTALGFGGDEDNDVEKDITPQASRNKSLKDVITNPFQSLLFFIFLFFWFSRLKSSRRKRWKRTHQCFIMMEFMMNEAENCSAKSPRSRKERRILLVLTKSLLGTSGVLLPVGVVIMRSRDDHLYADKDKFVTAAYKRKLAEQEKWMAEERLRELKEEKEDLVARKQGKQEKQAEFRKLENLDDQVADETSDRNHALSDPKFVSKSSSVEDARLNETSPPRSSEPLDPKPVSDKTSFRHFN